jgi:hypothetical protein
MKRTGKIASIAVMAILFLSSMAGAQEKKEQQKIKIVVADNSGTKVVIDTTFAGSITPDSITLKDGNVIYIRSGNCDMADLDKSCRKEKKIYVTVTDDEKGDKNIRKEITVIAGDSSDIHKKTESKKIIVISDGKALAESSYDITVSTDGKDEGKGRNETVYYYVNTGKDGHKSGNEKFNIEVNSDEPDVMDVEKSSYVIAKDGMVVTIEGGSEEKVKELASIIESKLGVKKDSKTGKK